MIKNTNLLKKVWGAMLVFFIIFQMLLIKKSFAISLKNGIPLAKLECKPEIILSEEEKKNKIEARKMIDPNLITPDAIEMQKESLKKAAKSKKLSENTIEIIDTLIFSPNVAKKESSQPERILSFEEYFTRVMPQSKIRDAQKFLEENFKDLEKVENQYKVDKEVIVSLMLSETYFGRVLGSYNILDSLFTLSLTSHRPNFWIAELMNILTLIEKGGTLYTRNTKGSWAGAVGLVQFIPSSFIRFAQDGDGDGFIDIINSKADAFASAANYLKLSGWQYKHPYLKEIDQNFTQEELCKLAGMPFEEGVLVTPDKKLETKTFIAYSNYAVVLLWNKSLFFSTTVGIVFNELKNAK